MASDAKEFLQSLDADKIELLKAQNEKLYGDLLAAAKRFIDLDKQLCEKNGSKPSNPIEGGCAVCHTQEKLFRCAKCKSVQYCSRECQKQHWPHHKQACMALRKTVAEEAPASSGPQQKATEVATTPGQSAEKEAEEFNASAIATSALEHSENSEDKEENIGDIMDDHSRFLKSFDTYRTSLGINNPKTLGACFDLLNSYIGLYRLEPCDALLNEIFPVCESVGPRGSEWHIKAIQCRAFLRYKQHRFNEALQDFLQFKSFAGPSAELAENTGHTYNTLGMYPEAEASFRESLTLMDLPDAPPKSRSNRGGVLLGLGLVQDRLGKTEAGLKILHQALDFYRNRFPGGQHSLIAKTLMSVGRCNEKLGELQRAEASYKEATEIFQFTCGDDTPLTANAIHYWAKAIHAQKIEKRFNEAVKLLLSALGLYVNFDTLGVYMNIITEIVTDAKTWLVSSPAEEPVGNDTRTSLQRLHARFLPFLVPIRTCVEQVKAQKIAEDGNIAVFYKTSAEISMLAGRYDESIPLLTRAVPLFRTVTEVDCSNLIKECEEMIKFCAAQVAQSASKQK